MLVAMKRERFDALDSGALAWEAIEPVMQAIRAKGPAAQSAEFAERFAAQLTSGQRALLPFWVLYGHSRSGITEFFDAIPHMPGQTAIWSKLKTAMRYFNDDALLQLVEDMETLYYNLVAENPGSDVDRARGSVEGTSEHREQLAQLNLLLQEAMPAALPRIGMYVRNHPDEFVLIEELGTIPQHSATRDVRSF